MEPRSVSSIRSPPNYRIICGKLSRPKDVTSKNVSVIVSFGLEGIYVGSISQWTIYQLTGTLKEVKQGYARAGVRTPLICLP